MAKQAPQVTIKARSELGSRANKRLRDAGFVPGVIYGHKEAVVPVTLPKKEVTESPESRRAFVRSFPRRQERKSAGEGSAVRSPWPWKSCTSISPASASMSSVEVTVPIELKGEPNAEDGGVVTQVVNQIEIECLVTDIPDVIRVNIADMKLDDVIAVKDLQLPHGVKVKLDPDVTVVTFKEVKEEEAATVEGGTAEPEVIGRKAEDEPAAEGAAAAAEEKK